MLVFKKLTVFVVSLILLLQSFLVSASAKDDFEMKKFDKTYVTFIFDDNRMPFTKECFELFKKYDIPMSCAVIGQGVKDNPELIKLLKEIESEGGEILSHTYSHYVFTESNTTGTKEEFEKLDFEFGESFKLLRSYGFDVNGIICAGNGGEEATADYDFIEGVTRKYYKYSDLYGVSPQYQNVRKNMTTARRTIRVIETAQQNKDWIILFAHDFNEISKDDLEEVLKFISENDDVEAVTWKHIYDNFGVYTGDAVPTEEALQGIEEITFDDEPIVEQNDDLKADNTQNETKTSNLPLIIGISAAVFVIIVTVVLLAIKFKK